MSIVLAQPKLETQVIVPDEDLNLTLTEDWVVQTYGPTADWSTDPLFFIGDPLFPAIGSSHSRNSALRFKTFARAEQQRSDLWLFHGMKFSTKQREAADDFQQDRYDGVGQCDRDWSHTAVTKVLERAYVADPTGGSKFTRPVAAGSFSANPEPVAVKETGEPILGLQETSYIPVCNFVRNEISPPAALVTGGLVGVVNSDSFTLDGLTVPAQTALIQDIRVSAKKSSLQPSTGNQISFRTVSYQIAVNSEGWDTEALNHGYYAVVVKNGTTSIEKIKVADGLDESGNALKMRPTSSPQLIDINGKFIDTDPNSPNYNASWRDDVHWRVFRSMPRVSFAGFSFT